jgi:acetolactate synthase-1/2/3 large subunit
MHHEQSAAFAAEGVSRKGAGSSIGLAMGTSGPGATNLITGIGSCWFDSVPCLFLTGQVNVSELKQDRNIRQQGFQELDIVSLVHPITKYAARVMTAESLLPELHRALTESVHGRQGPVLLDIPNNIQKDQISLEIVSEWVNRPIEARAVQQLDSEHIGKLSEMCSTSRRPLFLLGGGAKWSRLLSKLLSSLQEAELPYVSTLMGQERLEWSESYFGMIGTYGHRSANCAIQQCDLLIVIGARLDIRQTGADVQDFAKNAKLVHIDIEAGQLDNRIKADLPLNVSADGFLDGIRFSRQLFPLQDPTWIRGLRRHLQTTFIDEYPEWDVSPFRIFAALAQAFSGREVDFVCDVGNHQMWAAHCLRLGPGQAMHHSGGMGAMGFALPAAIGISTVSTGKTVVLTGDGSLQVNIQELDTVARVGADILIVVFNNRSLGMVKNFQDMYFQGRNRSTKLGYSSPAFAKVAESFGLESHTISDEETLRKTLLKVRDLRRPVLLEIMMEHATECRPRLVFGNPIDQQHPRLDEVSCAPDEL